MNQANNFEWIEKRIGSWFAILGIVVLPVPFVGLFSILNLVTFIIVGFSLSALGIIDSSMDSNQVYVLMSKISIVYMIVGILFIMLNLWVMYKQKSYGQVKKWLRLLCYVVVTIINMVYAFFITHTSFG